jgi:hypothetical protein
MNFFARTRRINLVLVAKRRMGHTDDFRAVGKMIEEQDPKIRVYVVADRQYHRWWPWHWRKPTLTVSPVALQRLQPRRGSVLQNRLLTKHEEYLRLTSCGLPVPRWEVLHDGLAVDLSQFGEYVVTKPDCGGRGAEVKIKRRSRVRWKPPRNQRAIVQGQTGMIVQEFIYTGPWPTSYRVTTLFGRVLFAWKVTAATSRRPLRHATAFRDDGERGGGISIVSNAKASRFELTSESDVLDLAARAHAAFPQHPLLGIDILRSADDGRLYIAEANSCGQVWHFSNQTGLGIQRDNQIDFKKQFNGLDVAAKALIVQTHKLAC